jgi:hypothetical protein
MGDASGPVLVSLDEHPEGTVVGLFDPVREKARRQLPVAPVIGQAFATDPLAAAGLPAAVAMGHVLLGAAFFHRGSLFIRNISLL